MYLTFSFWILMFSCARRVACSKILRCCCRSAAAAAGSAVVLGFSLCFLLRSRCYCCSLLSFSLSTLSLSVSLLLLSQSCCPPVYTIYMCERASTVRLTFFSSNMGFSNSDSGKKSKNFTIQPFLATSNNSAFWPFFAKKNSGSTAVNTHILSGCLSLAALSVLLPSHVYNFYV